MTYRLFHPWVAGYLYSFIAALKATQLARKQRSLRSLVLKLPSQGVRLLLVPE